MPFESRGAEIKLRQGLRGGLESLLQRWSVLTWTDTILIQLYDSLGLPLNRHRVQWLSLKLETATGLSLKTAYINLQNGPSFTVKLSNSTAPKVLVYAELMLNSLSNMEKQLSALVRKSVEANSARA